MFGSFQFAESLFADAAVDETPAPPNVIYARGWPMPSFRPETPDPMPARAEAEILEVIALWLASR